MVGQVLYLEAEASAVGATDIGCYYHFAIGGPVEDLRVTTLPAYGQETHDGR